MSQSSSASSHPDATSLPAVPTADGAPHAQASASAIRPDVVQGIVRCLSADRFESYRAAGDHDDLDVIARYAWNMAMCSALYPLLNVFEVTLRNRLYQLISSKYPASFRPTGVIPCWLDFTPSILTEREVRSVEKAKQRLPKPRKGQARSATSARLVAELTLDFWVFLLHEPYEKGARGADADLWPKMLKSVFPSMDPARRTMLSVRAELEAIRVFRNRVFHHEPIWKDDVANEVERLLLYTHAMQKEVGTLLRAADGVTALLLAGPAPWRERIATMLTHPKP